MSLKYYKPITPSQRGLITLDLSPLKISTERKKNLKPVLKFLREGKAKKGGRNNQGKITVRHRGGGHKQRYLKILFSRSRVTNILDKFFKNIAFMARIEEFLYDPNRNTSAALISVSLVDKSYNEAQLSKESKKLDIYYDFKNKSLWFAILNTKDLVKGDFICVSKTKPSSLTPQKIGEALPIEKVPLGTFVHNIEIYREKGGQIARSAGTFGQVLENSESNKRVRIRLPSGQERWVYYGYYVTLGSVAHEEWKLRCIAKAGRNRWLGWRPTVRGVAMNPIDHPHGGGEGKTSGGRPSVTPWGRPTRNWTGRAKRKNPFSP